MRDKPDFECSRCGCAIYCFPPQPDWGEARRRYAACGLDVPEPTCDTCLIDAIREADAALTQSLARPGVRPNDIDN